MILTYEHCDVRWQSSENHFDGDVCYACGERVEPLTLPENETEPEYEKGD